LSIVQPAGALKNSIPSVIEGYKHVKQIFPPHPAKTDNAALDHAYTYDYDMRSQLTSADITNIIGTGNWSADYSYHKNGDMSLRTIQSNTDTFTYTGNLMATLDGTNLNWDENGQLTAGASAETLSYNWDGKLRSAAKGTKTISLKYDPMGNRIFKSSTVDSVTTDRKYIIDIVGSLPVILLELEGSTVKKKYVYANSQILSQYDGDTSSWYYYLHDRPGSVRQLIKYVSPNVNVVKLYTYEPFGKTLEDEGTLSNPFMFTGQWYDSETGQYYLRARQYEPYISRFTSCDPVTGKFEEPLTLHRYLYCGNDPIDFVDTNGEWALMLGASVAGNFTFSNLNFGGWQERGLNSVIQGVSKGSLGSLLSYYTVTMPYFAWLAENEGLGGSAGGAFVVAHNEEEKWNRGWSFGGMSWLSGGASFSTGAGVSATVDFGFSPEAQHVEKLAGNFVEAGGSFSSQAPFLPWGINTASLAVSWAYNEDWSPSGITLYTGSLGWGTPGREAHAFVGKAWVKEWFK